MIPLIPTLAFAFVSFICSAFVILRTVIPILPPSPLSRRAPPSEFGLPNFRTLSPADKNHLWLAGCDVLALTVFVTQAVLESLRAPSDYAEAHDPGSAVRLWLALTVRQTCLLVAATITLLHVRMGRSVSLGSKHWILWAPTLLIAVTSTTAAGVLAGAGVGTFFSGIVYYSSVVGVITSIAFIWLITTLVMIKRNIASLNKSADSWPPVREDKPRASFATEDINAMRDGSSWITSNASSCHDSVSDWSFSLHANRMSRSGSIHANPVTAVYPSKSSSKPNPATRESNVPAIPPLPSRHRDSVASTILGNEPDLFRRETSGPHRERRASQGSWLTSPSASQVTLPRWSYPTTHADASAPNLRADMLPAAPLPRPNSPQVLGGYAPGRNEAEKGLELLAMTNDNDEIDVSFYRLIGWLIAIWAPFGLALPYFIMVSPSGPTPLPVNVLLSLSVAISSPILAINILFRSPLPIPVDLFDTRTGSSPTNLDHDARDYKRSGSVTVVEGRRSGDIWLANGDAVECKTKLSRAMGMLSPAPKLSVLPSEECGDDCGIAPLSLQLNHSPSCGVPALQSQNGTELGRAKSIVSSHDSAANESLACVTEIRTAQKHYTTLAQTVRVRAAPERGPSVVDVPGSAAIDPSSKGYPRARSVSCPTRPQSTTAAPTTPPSSPLPPTPPNIKSPKRGKTGHGRSLSTGAFPLIATNDIYEIDAMTAGLLPRLVPGLKVGSDMKIRGSILPAGTLGAASKAKHSSELGALTNYRAFSSPELHSTPARRQETQSGKISGQPRNHYSLPSLDLGKEGIHSLPMWEAEINDALENQVGILASSSNNDLVRRATAGGDSLPDKASRLNAFREDEGAGVPPVGCHLGRSQKAQSLGLSANLPVSVNRAHESVTTLLSAGPPPSAASTVTLFDDFEAGLGPQAESTPLDDQKKNHPISKKAPPRNRLPTPHNRRSSIVYIKSNDDPSTNSTTSPRSFSQVVRQLVSKRSILQRKSSSDTKPGSPGGNLRPLSLLQDRDTNRQMTGPGGTRPLHLRKKKQQQLKTNHDDENLAPQASPMNRHFKQLAHSETNKQREVLRASERLPDVDVHPPAADEHLELVHGYDTHSN